MPHLPFITAAFAVTGLGMAWLIVSSYLAMRRSEALADDLRQDS
jgi:heme exporter protein CcmD